MHPGTKVLPIALLALLFAISSTASADETYAKHVKPLLRERCFACHGALKQEGGLRLDTAMLMRAGGDSGAAIEPGSPEESYLLDRVTANDESERMPPEGKPLTSVEVDAIRTWIQAGANGPDDEAPEDDPRDHWAFQQPRKSIPSATASALRENIVDSLLAEKQQEQNVSPVKHVARGLLLRRVYLDLIGVPPTRDQLHAFLADDSPDAFERTVDRLLASPQYGERWGRHWMDVWRYSDWYGLGKQLRYSQKHIWRWRDWIVESLNHDVGYDRMVQLMLAADELEPSNQEALRATGFLARNYYLFNRTTWLDSTLEHTSKSLLGLTVNCAKCHDHKYDAISQRDYYAMRAIFEPHQVRLDPVAGETDLEKSGLPRIFDAHLDATTFVHVRGDEKNPDKSKPIPPGVLNVVLADAFTARPVALPPEAARPQLLPFVRVDRLVAAQAAIEAAEQALAKANETLRIARKTETDKRNNAAESGPQESSTGKLFVDESFDRLPNSAAWERIDGEWSIRDGKLLQLRDGVQRAALKSKQPHPRDFHAVLEFTTLGGSKWRSVGVCFDSADGHENMVYLSAVQPGSKLQVSQTRNGAQSYPVEGRVNRPVELNKPYRLELLVRDRLLNVRIDGEHALAYALPDARRDGKLQLIAFDAKVAFDRLQVHSLSAKEKLLAASAATPAIPASKQAQLQVTLAEKRLEVAKLYPEALTTALDAERENLVGNSGSDAAKPAIVAHLKWQAAKAEEEIAAAQLEANTKTRAQKATAAKKRLAQLQMQLASDKLTGSYLPVHASRKALEGPAETEASRRAPYPQTSTGRRSAFARWLTNERNPLTARVAVNQVWLRHFGQPLVAPVDDFGRRTKQPPLQSVLDQLAVDFMENGWRFKRLHRQIVTSAAYRLSTSTKDAPNASLESDPENQLFWRRQPRRMESELIRDSLLHMAGGLDWQTGGPSLKPQGRDQAAGRRSLYFTHSRDDQHGFLTMFDHADILRCYRRSESIVPQQALTLANSRLSLEAARSMAAATDSFDVQDDGVFIEAAFETILTRSPTPPERQACLDVLSRLRSAAPKGDDRTRERRARANLLHALINHNDFVTIR